VAYQVWQWPICSHVQREEIEFAFIGWRSPATIAMEFGLADRASVYRHAHALGLFPKRQRNIRAALGRIIERADSVDVTASAVVGQSEHTPRSIRLVSGLTGRRRSP